MTLSREHKSFLIFEEKKVAHYNNRDAFNVWFK